MHALVLDGVSRPTKLGAGSPYQQAILLLYESGTGDLTFEQSGDDGQNWSPIESGLTLSPTKGIALYAGTRDMIRAAPAGLAAGQNVFLVY